MKNPITIKKYSEKKLYGKDTNIIIILGISIAISAILFILGALCLAGIAEVAGNLLTGMDLIVIGLLTSIGPIGFYNHLKANKKRAIETHLPDFLREISSSTSSGMTVFDAIISASKGDHGKLTPELQRMAAQLSWGISVQEALENLAKRINTPSIKRMAVTINKALEIGGNTSTVFEAAAKEIDQAKLIEEQRKAEMSLYAIVVFISFFVFLAVILILNTTVFAAIFDIQTKMASSQIMGSSDFTLSYVDPIALKNAFFSFVLVQSIGGGLLGGFMMDGKVSSGVRFAFVLTLVSFFIFKILL